MIRPRRLAPGDRVAVVAPSGPVPRDRFAVGRAILAERYQLVHDERIFARAGFLAGDDEARRGELAAALADRSLRAVFCARGGYGLTRLLARLEPRLLLDDPKPIVGFSDVTALHAWARRAGVISVHGPVVTHLAVVPAEDAGALFSLLESPEPAPPLTGLRALKAGVAEGPLVGGNLELVSRLVGTPWQLDLRGAVLLVEEVGERPYRIDRMLTQLESAGALAGLAGVVLGELNGCEEKDGSPPSAEAVVLERLAPLGVPIAAGAPVGHGARNRALPHGARVRLDATTGSLTFLDPAVA